jgi:predicted transcriptional regulator of viral defense system
MINKYISTQSNEILYHFNQLGKDCFDYAEASNALPNSSESALKELLSDMVRRGLLMRIKKELEKMKYP